MKLSFLGAAQTVTGSKTLVEHEDLLMQVDCGLFQGPKPMRNLNWEKPEHLDRLKTILLTHAHIDHSGLIPRYYAQGWRGEIYCTETTAKLLQILLPDSGKLHEEDSDHANRTKYSNHSPALPLYTEKDAIESLNLIRVVDFQKTYELSKSLRTSFYPAGHILGSSILQIDRKQTDASFKTTTFSGDLGSGRSEILKPPYTGLTTDELILESTYGDRNLDHSLREEEIQNIIQKVIDRKGTLIIPAFAVGRAQDLLLCIFKLFRERKIPDIEIYLDSPMANSVTQLYRHNIQELREGFQKEGLATALSYKFFHPVENLQESLKLQDSESEKIIISASGMLQGGRVLHHLKKKLPSSKNAVLFVGYQAENTKGRLLLEGIDSLRIHHQEIPVKAEIFQVPGFSAHADSDALLSWVQSFQKPPKKFFINHGEPDAQEHLGKKLRELYPEASICIPKQGQSFDLSYE